MSVAKETAGGSGTSALVRVRMVPSPRQSSFLIKSLFTESLSPEKLSKEESQAGRSSKMVRGLGAGSVAGEGVDTVVFEVLAAAEGGGGGR
jgi:hypothetical protein